MMSQGLPFVSIIIPCRNEERFIDKCLDSIVIQAYPKDKLEVLVVDGMSTDKTREIVNGYVQKYFFIKLLKNPRKVTPFAMNIGIRNSKGEIIILVNAHSMLEKNFLKNNIEYLNRTKADAVGGMLNTINVGASIISKAIPLATDSIFGAGGRRYRSRIQEGFVKDTLPYCAYRKELFDKIGLIDEDLIRDQDEEFNYRILKNGGKIFFTPQIKSYLHVRPTLKKLWKQHFQYGFFKPLVLSKVGGVFTWRQAIPSLLITSVVVTGLLSFLSEYFLWFFILILGLYFSVTIIFSLLTGIKRDLRLMPFLMASFFTLHFSYGTGYLKGILDFILLKKHLKLKVIDVDLTR
jgi:cellulose synthase/poly-beta-1,6-N-acetylglucosamine synthase-like glycosyltransferase